MIDSTGRNLQIGSRFKHKIKDDTMVIGDACYLRGKRGNSQDTSCTKLEETIGLRNSVALTLDKVSS